MKPSALTLFVVGATLCAAIVIAYAASATLSPVRLEGSCCDTTEQATASSTITTYPVPAFTAFETESFTSLSSGAATQLVAAIYEARAVSQPITSVSVNSGLASEGNIDLVLLQNASIKVTSCQVLITEFQKGTLGASTCEPSTTKQVAANYVQFDGEHYDFTIGPLLLPPVNQGLQVSAELDFGNRNSTVVYDLVA
jgi:hypothetical protein